MDMIKEELQEMGFGTSGYFTFVECNKRSSDFEQNYNPSNKKIKTEFNDLQSTLLTEEWSSVIKTESEMDTEFHVKDENNVNSNEYGGIKEHTDIMTSNGNVPHLYKCGSCNFVNTSILVVQQHALTHKMEKSAQKCPFCDFLYVNLDILSVHLRDNHSDRTINLKYKCCLCNYQDSDYLKIQRHIVSVHVPVLHNRFKCAYCDFYAAQAEFVSNHIKECHASEFKHLNEQKLTSYNNNDQNSEVVSNGENQQGRIIESKQSVNVPPPLFVCSVCKCVYRTLEDYDWHKSSSHIENPAGAPLLRCQFCRITSISNTIIEDHMNIYHRSKFDPSYAALATNTVTNSQSNTQQVYKCKLCLYQSDLTNYWVKHTEQHKDQLKGFLCGLCDVIVQSKKELHNHLSQHAKTQRLKTAKVTFKTCPMCDFQGTFKTLYDHFDEIHGDDYIYTCKTCGHKAIQYDALKIHMKIIHKIKD